MSEIQHENSNNSSHASMTSEQRKYRYRTLLDQVEILQENEETGLQTTDELYEIVENVNLLFKDSNIKERIKHTGEVLLDAKVVAAASDVLLQITESIECTLDEEYEYVDLARKITSEFLINDDPEVPDFTELSKIAFKILNEPPKFSFIYGDGGLGNPIIKEKLVKVKKPRTQKDKHATKTVPEKVTEINKEEDSVDDTVKFLQWALNKECEETNTKNMSYFNFIIDPSNYSKTIENMFHCSFLVRDGRAKMAVDKNGVIQITPVSGHDSKKAKRSRVMYKQNIISIDIDEWKAVIKTFSIKNCLLSKWKTKWDARKKDES